MSRSGFYSWRARPESIRVKAFNEKRQLVRESFFQFKSRYGSPRIFMQLQQLGIKICENSIAKIMKEEGLFSRKKKNFKVVTMDEKTTNTAHERLFKIEESKVFEINEIWAGDITYIPIDNRFLYLSIVTDLRTRKIVG